MAKSTLKFDDVKRIVDDTITDPEKHKEAVGRLRKLLSDKVADEKTNAEKPKSKYVLLVTKPSPKGERTGWPLTIPEEMNPAEVLPLVHKIVYEFNNTKKGRRHPITTVGEAMENLPKNLAKDHGLGVRKSKEPAWVQEIDSNQIPGTEELRPKGE